MLGKYTTPFRRISFFWDASPSFLPRGRSDRCSAGGGESQRRDLFYLNNNDSTAGFGTYLGQSRC